MGFKRCLNVSIHIRRIFRFIFVIYLLARPLEIICSANIFLESRVLFNDIFDLDILQSKDWVLRYFTYTRIKGLEHFGGESNYTDSTRSRRLEYVFFAWCYLVALSLETTEIVDNLISGITLILWYYTDCVVRTTEWWAGKYSMGLSCSKQGEWNKIMQIQMMHFRGLMFYPNIWWAMYHLTGLLWFGIN